MTISTTRRAPRRESASLRRLMIDLSIGSENDACLSAEAD